MLAVVTTIKLIAEIALLALLGQWLLHLVIRGSEDANVFYRILQTMARPFVHLARMVSPRSVLERHRPLIAFLLLAFAWGAATLFKIRICLQTGMELCR